MRCYEMPRNVRDPLYDSMYDPMYAIFVRDACLLRNQSRVALTSRNVRKATRLTVVNYL